MNTNAFTTNPETGEIIFKPKYDPRLYLSALVPPILFLISLWLDIGSKNNSTLSVGTIFFGIFTLLIPFIFIREIRFGQQMVVKYFLFKRVIEFNNIKGISRMAIRLEGRGVSLAAVENVDDLIESFSQLIRTQPTAKSNDEAEVVTQIQRLSKWSKYTVLFSLLLAVGLNYFYELNVLEGFIISWLLFWGFIYAITKLKNQ